LAGCGNVRVQVERTIAKRYDDREEEGMSKPSTDDTDPAVEAILIDGYQRMSPSQKLDRVRALTRAVQELALADIRRRHPDADEREQLLRLASRWIEPDLMVCAIGWDVRKTGY
jgi:hypothetical protein